MSKEILDSFSKPEILSRLPENLLTKILENRDALEPIVTELQEFVMFHTYLNRFAISTLVACPFLFETKLQMSPLGILAYISSLVFSLLIQSQRGADTKKILLLELKKKEILDRIMPLLSGVISNDIRLRELLSEGKGRYEDFPI